MLHRPAYVGNIMAYGGWWLLVAHLSVHGRYYHPGPVCINYSMLYYSQLYDINIPRTVGRWADAT